MTAGVRWLGALLAAAGMVVFASTCEVTLVRGASMAPALAPGDVCVVRRGAPAASGDIALFEHGGRRVLHRVVRVRQDGSLLTRGDANPTADWEPVPPGCVRGTTVAVVHTSSLLEACAEARAACATLTAQSHRQTR